MCFSIDFREEDIFSFSFSVRGVRGTTNVYLGTTMDAFTVFFVGGEAVQEKGANPSSYKEVLKFISGKKFKNFFTRSMFARHFTAEHIDENYLRLIEAHKAINAIN